MLIRWLTTVFPSEMRQGWGLVRADLVFWCSLAAALTLLAYSRVAPETESTLHGAALALVVAASFMRVMLTPVVLMAAGLRFEALTTQHEMPWRRIAAVVLERLLPGLTAWLAASGLCLGLSFVAQQIILGVVLTATSAAGIPSWAPFTRWLIFVIILVRFAFVPFLVALRPTSGRPATGRPSGHPTSELRSGARPEPGQRADRPSQPEWPAGSSPAEAQPGNGSAADATVASDLAPSRTRSARLPGAFWPLTESNRMTRGVRLRLFPYVVLAIYAPAAAATVPVWLRPVVSFGLHLVAFTAVGVLFLYYSERRGALGSASVSRDETTSVPVLGGASQTSPAP